MNTMTTETSMIGGRIVAVLRFFDSNGQIITSATTVVRPDTIDEHVRRVEACHGPVARQS